MISSLFRVTRFYGGYQVSGCGGLTLSAPNGDIVSCRFHLFMGLDNY